MSRNFTADQILTERLIINDTKAFEEVYRRYWYSLYFYGLRKLHSHEESRHLVQHVFADLWLKRNSFPASFHLAQYLYEEGKKDVVKRLSQKTARVNNPDSIEADTFTMTTAESIQQIPGLSAEPVEIAAIQQRKLVRYVNNHTVTAENRHEQVWPSETKLNTYLSYKEKDKLEQELLEEIENRTGYRLLFSKKEIPWWQKIAAMF